MKNYRNQDSCCNCNHVFIRIEYDDGDMFYCNINEDRPKQCGSVYMGESFSFDSDEIYMKKYKEWNGWAEKHWVCSNGICDCYMSKTNKINNKPRKVRPEGEDWD